MFTAAWIKSKVYRVKPSKTPQQIEKESIIAEMEKLSKRMKELDV